MAGAEPAWFAAPADLIADADAPAITRGADLTLPAASSLDPQHLFEVAAVTNLAHAALGTELVRVGPHRGVIRLRWRADLAERDGTWAPGVLATLADHVCSFTSVVSLGDLVHFGGTMSLRVEYSGPVRGDLLVARAHANVGDGNVLRLTADVHVLREASGVRSAALAASARCAVVDRRLAR